MAYLPLDKAQVKILLLDIIRFKICFGLLEIVIQLKLDGSHKSVPGFLRSYRFILRPKGMYLQQQLDLSSHTTVVANDDQNEDYAKSDE